MDYSYLGTTDLRCSRLGLGCSHFGSFSIPKPERHFVSLVHQALDAGIVVFDTADSYGQGSSEQILGKALLVAPQPVVVITKAGYRLSTAAKFGAKLKSPLRFIAERARPFARAMRRGVQRARPDHLQQCFEPDYLAAAIDGSLRRLNREAIDLFLLHSPPQSVLRDAEILSFLHALRAKGKIRHFGASCNTTDDALVALHWPGVAAIQISLTDEPREKLDPVLSEASRRRVGVIGRTVLQRGKLGSESSITPSLISDALLHALSPEVAVALIGTTNPQHLKDNLHGYSRAIASGGLMPARDVHRC